MILYIYTNLTIHINQVGFNIQVKLTTETQKNVRNKVILPIIRFIILHHLKRGLSASPTDSIPTFLLSQPPLHVLFY